ncbi:MAG: Energy-coupling factor transporter transmembrane protein EcfT [Pelotomaculum sp. PtaU1.Bin035]|nr:MAG: Energy-coupling factor transporter transmembrane protein EcfT [Pelotomaculum sp. PtaU1.Bin035]
MLSDITFGRYIPGNSLLHRLDPRTKVICALAAAVAVIIAVNWYGFILLAGFAFISVALSGLSSKTCLSGLRSLWVLLAITFFAQVLLTPGEVLLGHGALKVSREGLEAGSRIFMQLALLIMFASLLTFTTSPVNLTAGIESILSPLKRVGVPAHELAMMVTIALRFVPTLLAEAEIIMKAQRSRGARFGSGGALERVKSLLPLFVPLFAGALRRADELATAMEARCYRGGAGRTRMNSFVLDLPDYVAIGVSIAVLAGSAVLRIL